MTAAWEHEFDALVADTELYGPGPRNNGASTRGDTAFTVEAANFIDWSTWWDRDHTATDWLVEPLLARGRATSIVASPKAGKSLLMLEMAAALATGRRAIRQPAGPPVRTLYLDFEMSDADVFDRLTELGYSKADNDRLVPHLFYSLIPSLPPLDTPKGATALGQLVESTGAEAVIIDTFGRAVEGEENSNDTVRAYFQHTGMMLKRLGVTSARLDHLGKDKTRGGRGASAKNDDVDVVWELTAGDNDTITLKCTHQRMTWIEPKLTLHRRTGPLRHVLVDQGWPAGTKECADALDALGLNLHLTRRDATKALKGTDVPKSSTIIGAALRYRREQADLGSR